MLTDMLSCICKLRQSSKHLFIFPIKKQKKNWAEWAKWARILKSTLNDEQLHWETCFLVFAGSNKHQYITRKIFVYYSLFHANLDERKRCHLALRPDKSILKEVPGSKYAPILSCKISWAWDKDSALHINLKLMLFF